MKKKLLIILTVLIMLTGKVDAFTLTQKLGNEYIETTVEKDEVVNMKFTSKVGFQFKNWVVSGVTGIDTLDSSISFSMPNNNVTIEGKYDEKYVVTFNNNTGTGSMSSLEIPAGGSKNLTKNTFIKDGYSFIGWAETADGEVKYDDEDSIKPTRNMTLYAVWEEVREIKPITELNPGDYVEYKFPVDLTVTALGENTGKGTYNSTDGTWTWSNQSSTPATAYSKGWRVLYNNSGQLDIISAESVFSLELGTSGSASNNETADNLDGGKIGYAKAIYTLNDFCDQYGYGINEKGEVIGNGGRCPGQGTGVSNLLDEGIDLDDITHANIRTILGTTTGGDIIKEPWGDKYDDKDNNTDPEKSEVKRIATYTPHPSGYVWLASRRLTSHSDLSYFSVRRLYSSGSVSGSTLYYWDSSGISYANAYSDGVRPVVSLISGLKVVDGEGTAEKPYVLTK